MTRHLFIPLLTGFFFGFGLLSAGERMGSLQGEERIHSPEALVEGYLRYRETIWRLHPPLQEEPFDSIENSEGDGWYEKAWSRWLALPGWFVQHGQGPDALTEKFQSVLWHRGQVESLRIWEHPGREMLYIGLETPGKGVQVLDQYPAPDWEMRKGESVEEFYERELGTRRVVWAIRSPYAPEPEPDPTLMFRTMMALQPDELHLRWSSSVASTMEAEVEFGSALSGGPFTLWYLEGSLMSSFPADWSVGHWEAERPPESIWNILFPNPGGDGNLLFVRATLGIIDSDSDGMDDGWELWHFGELVNPNDDADNDGLTNLEEYLYGTDPNNPDTSGNGIPDGWEITNAGSFSIWPPEISSTLYHQQIETNSLILWNDTPDPVVYQISLTGHLGSVYSFEDSVSNSVPYVWTDIQQSGTLLTSISNVLDGSQWVDLANFSFPFFGGVYNRIYVGSNGFITFGSGSTAFTNQPLPSASAPAHLIAAFWDDLDTRSIGEIYVQEFADHLIVQFEGVGRYLGQGEYTFQIRLHESGSIKISYKDMQGILDSATVGIQGGTPRRGVQVIYNAPYVQNLMTVEFLTETPFLTLSETSGTLDPQSTRVIDATLSSLTLPFGTHTAAVTVEHDAAEPGASVQSLANLTVLNTPITVSLHQPDGPVTILESESLVLQATASHADGITAITFLSGETELASSSNSTFSWTWNDPPPGEHLIIVRATDVHGDIADSEGVLVTVLADTDGDGMPDGWEVLHGLDPLDATGNNGADGDFDGDGLTNLWEYKHGFDPSDPTDALRDTSDNGIPDWWEIIHFGTFGNVDASADSDNDGLTNLQEMIHGTHPLIADTDGDGVNDGDEVGQGSNPNDASDGGVPPPVNELVEVPFSVGDPSGSHSERWKMTIQGEGPEDTRQFGFVSPDFGQMGTQTFLLRRGNSYTITLSHVATNEDNGPDYDWEALIDGLPSTTVLAGGNTHSGKDRFAVIQNAWLLDNEDGLLGKVNQSFGPTDHTPGKTAWLLPVALLVDANRDGEINHADLGIITEENPWRWWYNDDQDSQGEGATNEYDAPKGLYNEYGGSRDAEDLIVNGVRDLLDFYPVALDIKHFLEVMPKEEYEYRISLHHPNDQTPAPLGRFMYTDQSMTLVSENGQNEVSKRSGHYHTDFNLARELVNRSLRGFNLNWNDYTKLSESFLEQIETQGSGTILVKHDHTILPEFAAVSPVIMRLEIVHPQDGSVVTTELPLSLSSVENKYHIQRSL